MQWGASFRPEYLKIARFADEHDVERVLCLTATATRDVAEDICRSFYIKPDDVFRIPVYRSKCVAHGSRYYDAADAGRPALLYACKSRTTCTKRLATSCPCCRLGRALLSYTLPSRSRQKKSLTTCAHMGWIPWCIMQVCRQRNARGSRYGSWSLRKVLYALLSRSVWALTKVSCELEAIRTCTHHMLHSEHPTGGSSPPRPDTNLLTSCRSST